MASTLPRVKPAENAGRWYAAPLDRSVCANVQARFLRESPAPAGAPANGQKSTVASAERAGHRCSCRSVWPACSLVIRSYKKNRSLARTNAMPRPVHNPGGH